MAKEKGRRSSWLGMGVLLILIGIIFLALSIADTRHLGIGVTSFAFGLAIVIQAMVLSKRKR